MTDKEYIENIDKVDTDELFHNLEYYVGDSYYYDLWYVTIEELKKRVICTPKGKWIIDGHHIRCNRCNEYICNTDREGNEIPDNFCPNCGSDMRGEEE